MKERNGLHHANSGIPLIGRHHELSTLWNQFHLASSKCTAIALVTGEPGIGKTRLIGEVATMAARDGALVLRGAATEAEGMPPYFPFIGALSRYIRATDRDQLEEQAGPGAVILSTILPELAGLKSTFPVSYPLPPEQARFRLYEAVSEFLSAIASERPSILILDDLQWADSASMDLLSHLARREPDSKLLILGACRNGEAGQNTALERTLIELNRLRVLTAVTLRALSHADVTALASERLGGEVDEAASRLLYTRSEGNPFFAEELLRDWLQTGVLVSRGECWRLETSRQDTIPVTITHAIRQRLDRLSSETVELLRTAAIIGRTFETEVLAEATGQDAENIEEQLLGALRAEMIRYGSGSTYAFVHDLIRECLYAEVTPVRRRRLHGFIGRALEVWPVDKDASRPAELAFHFAHSGDRARGAEYAQLAAQRAMDTYAFEAAAAYYRTAIDLVDLSQARHAELLLDFGDAALLAGYEQEAASGFERARAWFLRAENPQCAARAAHGLGTVLWRQDQLARARAAFETAAGLLQDMESALTVRVLVDLASMLAVSLGKQTEGLVHAERALEISHRLGDQQAEISASRTLGNLLVRGNNIVEGLPLLERALELAEASDDPVEAAECCSCLALAYMWKGELHRSAQMIERRIEHAERSRDLYQLRHAYTWRVMSVIRSGAWSGVEQLLDQAQAVAERLASAEPLAFVYHVRGAAAWSRGDHEAAEAWFGQAVSIFRRLGPKTLVWYLAPLGLVQLARGKQQEALDCIAEVEDLIADFPTDTIQTADPLVYLSIMAVTLRDHERARRYYSRLLPFRGLHIDFLVDRVLGELATLLGDRKAARAHLEAAEANARREANTLDLAFTLEAQANLDLAGGGSVSSKRPQELLSEALALFENLGMVGEARRIAARLADVRSERAHRCASLPAGLSKREAEVLRLVAVGETNREIAEQLFISEKTVINHLTSIFTKTGAENRAGAAVFAVRHGLA